MNNITKVCVAGASGHLGSVILDHLVKAGFQVTALTRGASSHTFPSSVSVKHVDYDSLDSLTNALTGQDATVSTLGTAAIGTQMLLVDAAAKAGVRRFIPSEFGSDTLLEKTAQLPVFEGKIAVQKLLKEKAAAENMTYTLIFTGPFLDYGIKIGVVMDLKNKSIELYDGGDRPFSATTTGSIGQAVVGTLKHFEETKNRGVYVRSTIITPNQLAVKGKKAVGSDGWRENVVSIDALVTDAWAELKKDNPNPGIFAFNFIKASVWGEGYGLPFQKVDNELLGIKELTDDEVQEVVNSVA